MKKKKQNNKNSVQDLFNHMYKILRADPKYSSYSDAELRLYSIIMVGEIAGLVYATFKIFGLAD